MRLGWLAAALLVGYVPSRSTGFDPVDREVQHRTGLGVAWPEESRSTAAIDALLTKPLDLDAAVRIALVRNHRLQARFDELGIAASQVDDATVLPPLTADANYKRAVSGSGSEIEVTVVQDVLDLLQIGQRRGVANAELRGAQIRAIAATVALAADVEMAFYDLIAAQQERELVQTAFDAANASVPIRRTVPKRTTTNTLGVAPSDTRRPALAAEYDRSPHPRGVRGRTPIVRDRARRGASLLKKHGVRSEDFKVKS